MIRQPAGVRNSTLKATATLLVVAAVVTVLAGCEIRPIPYATSVPQPNVTRPARYLDEIFGSTKTSSIHYATANDLAGNPVDLGLDLYQPTGDTVAQRPAMVVVHEGGFSTGDKAGALATFIAETTAKRGYVVVSISYRLLATSNCAGTGATADCRRAAAAATADAQAAVRWLRANAATYRIDPDRIAMAGMSSGAIVAIMAGIAPDLPDNPTNPLAATLMSGAPPNTSNAGFSSAIQAWGSISGGLPPDITSLDGGLGQALVDNFSTLPSPGYLFSGTADTIVPHAWAEATRDQLAGIGRAVVFGALMGAGHNPTEHANRIQSQLTAFYYYALTLEHADH